MSNLEKYIATRKERDPEFAENYEVGYANFRIGELLRKARLEQGLTQVELAMRLHTRKTAISRIENHAQVVAAYQPQSRTEKFRLTVSP